MFMSDNKLECLPGTMFERDVYVADFSNNPFSDHLLLKQI
jgi:hypothetical protein